MKIIPVVRNKRGRKPQAWLDELVQDLRRLKPKESVEVPVPAHYGSAKSFRSCLYRWMIDRGHRIHTFAVPDARAFGVYLANQK
jgi:hypothetical protein